jgi:hypothetical protein
MSLQSPFGPDINMQLMALQGQGGPYIPQRDPADMGSREQFMRMLSETRDAEARAYQRQQESEERGFGRQLELLKAGTGEQAKLQQDRMALEQQAKERFMSQQLELDREQDDLEAQIAISTGEERARLTQRHFEVKQKNEEMKSAISQSEATAAGLSGMSKTQRETLIQGLRTTYQALEAQTTRGISEANTIDFSAGLKNVVESARNKATGALAPGGGIPGIASYSDLHYAAQDPEFMTALAAVVPDEVLKNFAASSGEGGVVGAIARFGIEGQEGLLKPGGTIADRIKEAQAAASVSGSKSRAVASMLGGDLASKLGIDREAMTGLFADLDMLKIATQSGDPDRIKMVKDRVRNSLTNIGSQNGFGQEGMVEFFKAAAKSLKEGPANEKGVSAPRFGAVTGEGTNQDLINALGRGLGEELESMATLVGTIYGSGEIQRAGDYKRTIDAIDQAFKPSGPDKEVLMDEKRFAALLEPLLGEGANLAQAQYGFLRPDLQDEVLALYATLADLSGQNRITTSRQSDLAKFLADPANAQLLNQDVIEQMSQLAGARAGQAKMKSRKSVVSPTSPIPRAFP